MKFNSNIIGKVIDYAIRIEFQKRGSPHAHILIWIEKAPIYTEVNGDEVLKFVEDKIRCDIHTTD